VAAVAVSASASPADRVRALRAGYQEHVAKPVELGRLVATIERLTSPRPPSRDA
jgi:CheY-like chemotaxis protein